MKKFLVVLVMILVSMNVFAQFAGFEWGTDKRDVKKVNGYDKSHEECPESLKVFDNFVFGYNKTYLNNESTWITFGFYKDKLFFGSYQFDCIDWKSEEGPKDMKKEEIVNKFNKIEDFLVDLYGDQSERKIIWHNKTYSNDKSRWGLAVSKGQLEFISIWNLNNGTIIKHVLDGHDFIMFHTIRFIDVTTVNNLTAEEDEAFRNCFDWK